MSSSIRVYNQLSRLLLRGAFVAAPLLFAILLLAACGREKAAQNSEPMPPLAAAPASEAAWAILSSDTTAPLESGDPATAISNSLRRYLPAIKEGKESTLDGMETAPRYFLDFTLDTENRALTGTAEIVVTNNSLEPWSQIVFRLYPNLVHYGGDMFIHSASVDGYPANFNYQDANTTARILLPRPLLPGDKVTVALKWVLQYPSWVSDKSLYRLFGRSQEMVSLPLFYPTLAVYQQGASIGSGKWWTEIGSERGDSAFTDASLFAVRATLPAEQVPVTSGTLVVTSTVTPTQTQYVWITGPSREFLLHMSPLFSQASETAYGTTVTSYWMPGDEAAGRAALRYGVASLRAFSDYFGDYPFRDMRIAPAPISFRGMEYPQAMLLGVQLYGSMRNNLEFLTVHEMAHQWWYQMVHNDPVNTPWLDEGIAEYSTRIYFEAIDGDANAELMQYQRWESAVETLRTRESEVPIAGSVQSFRNGNQYESTVYGKGALFFDQLRQQLGERRFRLFLQSYLNGHMWGIVDADDFLAALHVQGRPDLVELYREWVGTPPAAAQASETGEDTP